MTARDIIAKVFSGAPFPSTRSLNRATDVLDALEAAGYRILAPGQLDGGSLEAAAKVADEHAPATTDMVSTFVAEVCDDIAADIRALDQQEAGK